MRERKCMKKIFKNSFMIILIFILIFVIYAKYIKKEKLINFGGYYFLLVLTGSMEPEIPVGSLIIIKQAEEYQIRRYYYFFRKWLFCNS